MTAAVWSAYPLLVRWNRSHPRTVAGLAMIHAGLLMVAAAFAVR